MVGGRKIGPLPYKAQPPDENFKDYATETEWKYYEAYCRLGNAELVGKETGVSRRAVVPSIERMYKRAAQQGYAPKFGITTARGIAPVDLGRLRSREISGIR